MPEPEIAAPAAEDDPRRRDQGWERRLTLTTLVAVASVPSILVFRDRWLDHAGVRTFLRETVWCRVPALCQTVWPSYFLLIFAAVAFVLATFLVLRETVAIARPADQVHRSLPPVGPRQTHLARALVAVALACIAFSVARSLLGDGGDLLKGPDALRSLPTVGLMAGIWLLTAGSVAWLVPLGLARETWRRQGRLWLAQGLALLAVVAALWVVNAPAALRAWPVALLAAGAVAAVWPRLRRSGPVLWLTLLALLLASLHLTAWWRVIVGDEYTFYYEASDIAFQRPVPRRWRPCSMAPGSTARIRSCRP